MANLPTESEVRTVTASEFRDKCLGLLDEVAETGVAIVVTKRGKPVARLVPLRRAPFGFYKDRMEILGDIVSPVDDLEWEEEWLKRWDEMM